MHGLAQSQSFGGCGDTFGLLTEKAQHLGFEGVASCPFLFQKRPEPEHHFGAVDFDRADGQAFPAGSAVLHEFLELGQHIGIPDAARFEGIEQGFQDGPQADVLVSGMMQDAFFRVEHGADLLALPAPGAGPDVLDLFNDRVLIGNIGFLGVLKKALPGQGVRGNLEPVALELPGVEDVSRVDGLLIGLQGLDLVLGEIADLGDADAVLSRDLPA